MKKFFGGLEKIQGHSIGILVALHEIWAMGRNLAWRAALFTGSYRLRQNDNACTACASFPSYLAGDGMDSYRRYIYDRCKICAGQVDSDKRRCREVSSFIEECKALWNVKIEKDSAKIHPLWICHKCRKTLSRFQVSQKSGKRYQSDKKPVEVRYSKDDFEKLHRSVSTVSGRSLKASEGSANWHSQRDRTARQWQISCTVHILNEIRRLCSAWSAKSAVQLASEVGERHGFLVIDLAEKFDGHTRQ